MAPSSTNSGIRTLPTGQSVVPASTRADGSVRKEIRVKPGYKPPEDVEKYKNRTAEAWKNRGKGGVPGAEALQEVIPPHKAAAANKNAKRREARRKAGAAGGDGGGEDDGPEGVAKEARVEHDGAERSKEVVDPEAEKAKEARKLAKKLRQARELKDKKEGGDSLMSEQLAKIINISELIRQLDGLGFDADGEKTKVDRSRAAD